MTTPSVLVVYGSKYGSTAGIARHVADTLRGNGITTDVRPAADPVPRWSYDAVVIGGGLYANRWHKDARRFLRRHHRELTRLPVWLFSSGPLDRSAAARDIPPVPGVRRAMNRLEDVEHITFGGCLTDTARGRFARMIVASGKGGDFRDFDRITAWAERVAALVGVARPEAPKR